MDIKQSFEFGMVALSVLINIIFELATKSKYKTALTSILGVSVTSFFIVIAILFYKYNYNLTVMEERFNILRFQS